MEFPAHWHSRGRRRGAQKGWPNQVGCSRGRMSWNGPQGSSISCAGIPGGPDEPDCGCKVLRPGYWRRQGVIIYPHKVFHGCYFFINNFLWAPSCPRAMASPHWMLLPLLWPICSFKGWAFLWEQRTGQLALASSLPPLPGESDRCLVSSPFSWTGP
jgi:hypothetical protein